MPVYNGEDVIARCLDGLARQGLDTGSFEIIVVNDGSTDGTEQQVSAWADAHPDVTVRIRSQQNSGPATARNAGARVAQGEFLLFTDADCVPARGWIKAFLSAFDGDGKPDAIMGAYLCEQVAPAAQFAQLEFEERYARMAAQIAKGESLDFVATYSAAYRRSAFMAVGGFDRSFRKANNEDVEFSYRLSERGYRIAFVPEARVVHEHDSSWKAYALTKVGRGYWRMAVYRKHPGKGLRDSYTPQLLKLQAPLAMLANLGVLLALLTGRTRKLGLAIPFALSAAPMVLFGLRRGSPATLWVPWGLWLRSMALVLGAGKAILDSVQSRRAGIVADEVQP